MSETGGHSSETSSYTPAEMMDIMSRRAHLTGSGGSAENPGILKRSTHGVPKGENLKKEWSGALDDSGSRNGALSGSPAFVHNSANAPLTDSEPDLYEQSNFPPTTTLPPNLSHLTLARLGLTSIIFPPGLKVVTLENLVSLDLSYNQLHSLNTPALSALPHLKHLDVSNNLLVRLATGGDNHLPATLESLDVSCNNLMRICGLDKCMDLKRLNLASNKLKTVTGLEFLASLR